MKRIAIVLVALLVVPSLASSASTLEKGIRRYQAETSDGRLLRFRTVREDPGRRLDGLFFNRGTDLACDDGTTDEAQTVGFTGWPWYYEGSALTVDEGRARWALHFAGTIRPASAFGTFRFTQRIYNADTMSSRLCTTGDLTWTAERI